MRSFRGASKYRSPALPERTALPPWALGPGSESRGDRSSQPRALMDLSWRHQTRQRRRYRNPYPVAGPLLGPLRGHGNGGLIIFSRSQSMTCSSIAEFHSWLICSSFMVPALNLLRLIVGRRIVKHGFDLRVISGHGLLVHHVDMSKPSFTRRSPGSKKLSRRLVRILALPRTGAPCRAACD